MLAIIPDGTVASVDVSTANINILHREVRYPLRPHHIGAIIILPCIRRARSWYWRGGTANAEGGGGGGGGGATCDLLFARDLKLLRKLT